MAAFANHKAEPVWYRSESHTALSPEHPVAEVHKALQPWFPVLVLFSWQPVRLDETWRSVQEGTKETWLDLLTWHTSESLKQYHLHSVRLRM